VEIIGGEAAVQGGFIHLCPEGTEVGQGDVAGMGFRVGQGYGFGVVAGDLDDAPHGFVSAGAVGKETPGVFGAGELDRAIAGEELAHGDCALLVDLAGEPDSSEANVIAGDLSVMAADMAIEPNAGRLPIRA